MATTRFGETRVSGIMQTDIVSVRPDATVRELVQLLAEEGVSGVPVLDADGTIKGVVSTTDVVRMAAYESEIPAGELQWVPDTRGHGDAGDDMTEEGEWGQEDEWGQERSPYYFTPDTPVWFTAADAPATEAAMDEKTVSEIMTPVAFTIGPDESVASLIRFFLRGRVHRALVVRDGELLGIVTPFDVMRGALDGPEESES